jgi:tetratricopeptide (TPR) repeat protein
MDGATSKYLTALIITSLLMLTAVAVADVKVIIAEGTYNMGDGETPMVAAEHAVLAAKRAALEEAGTYVESYSKVKDFQLTADEIQVLASGITEVTVLEKKRSLVGDGISFWVKIQAKVQTDSIGDMRRKIKDKGVVDEYKRIQTAYGESQKEIERLKRELAQANQNGKKQVEKKFEKAERAFQTNSWIEQAYQHSLKNDFDTAIAAYNQAIAIEPRNPLAYMGRGNAYLSKGSYDQAIEDSNLAIEIGLNSAMVYQIRGVAYRMKGLYDHAIRDLDRAITLDSRHIAAYISRGLAYAGKSKYNRAIEDYSRAISLDPYEARLYLGRGDFYEKSGADDRAIEDYSRAIALDSGMIVAYLSRAFIYEKKGLFNRAIDDYNRLTAMDPNNARAYFLRGLTYVKMGHVNKMREDVGKACRLGYERACKYLRN